MNNTCVAFYELKKLYPKEWVLLGAPEMKDTSVLGGVVLYHGKDKKNGCFIGRDRTADFSTVNIAFAGDLNQQRKIGILTRV
jgi:hypothetical protein